MRWADIINVIQANLAICVIVRCEHIVLEEIWCVHINYHHNQIRKMCSNKFF